MTSEPNLLNRITITIEANDQQVAKKVLHGSLLNQANINKLLNSYFDEYNIHQDISLETLTLNLGEIDFHDFNSLFPARLKMELNKAFSQYQINDHKEEILLEKSISSQFINNPSLSGDNNLINAENFIHSLYQQNPQLNTLEAITNNKEINKLIHQLAQIESQWILLLAKSCLSEYGIQRLSAIKQPALLNAINRRLSTRVNKLQPQEEFVSSGQLILNALEYLQRHNIQEIPKPNAKIISRITTEINNGVLNAALIITLFRKTVTENSRLNSWLKQLWQIAPIVKLCKKYLSAPEYKNLADYFSHKNPFFNEPSLQQTISIDSIFTEILQALVTRHRQDLPQLNQHQLSLIATAIQKGNVKTHTILALFQHVALYKRADTTWLTSLWQLAPVSQLCKQHLSVAEYQYLSQHFMPDHDNKSESSKKSTITSQPILLPEQTIPYQVSNAGILTLWPMLPALFNQLGFLEKQKFIHRQAQFSAVNFLDALIWGTEETPAERKRFNNVLCGLTADENSESISLEPEKQLITTQWLDTVITQLPGWKKLSRNDVRQLFLQRPGELLINDQEINISIQQQPFDALLADWPWPLNIAKLPWLDHPLLIDWRKI
ncbi:contractile injection system tape measure protein [Photorhabdus sp. APURE]|uniref:contractile injection system tape measure protein n=1 Tax=Photorhabdus aballayi TaxID=2991723 RepID=UPI00223D963A|nr:contractile injection system tape measure protein [Photorhabdus aballayi]MCW7550385.1 contractile injection system tape measure protein [Photorhabdus aballayi]